MKRTDRNLLALIAFALLFVAARIVSAQDIAENDDATALILAQAFIYEAGWEAADEHAAIAHCLAARAADRGVPLQSHAIEYVALFDARVKNARKRWVMSLRLDARKPNHWPQHLSWSAHSGLWLQAIERARAFLRGELRNICPGADHYGMSDGYDMVRAQRARWHRVTCSAQTLNAFWVSR